MQQYKIINITQTNQTIQQQIQQTKTININIDNIINNLTTTTIFITIAIFTFTAIYIATHYKRNTHKKVSCSSSVPSDSLLHLQKELTYNQNTFIDSTVTLIATMAISAYLNYAFVFTIATYLFTLYQWNRIKKRRNKPL